MSITAPGTPKLKQLLICCVLLMFLLPIVGVFSDTLLHDQVYATLSVVSALLAIAMLIVMFKQYRQPQSALRVYFDRQNTSPRKVTLYCIIGIPVFFQLAFAKGLPVLLHSIISKPAIAFAVVEEQRFGYYNRGCNGGLYIQGYRYWYNNFICDISKEDWDALKPGDTLVLRGYKSLLGFDYQQYRVLNHDLMNRFIASSIRANQPVTQKEAQEYILQNQLGR
ncbi:hypothetical protein [Photobacterium nomapromontoriensis]|uniref:hypothetical protein n=1 Tax=Photobacterium nomapromontoriensis TaxID=2910237 RepID=UPI003D0D17C2